MAKYTILVGANYEGTPKSKDYDLGAGSAHQVGSVIARVIEDEPKAINFQILVQREEDAVPEN